MAKISHYWGLSKPTLHGFECQGRGGDQPRPGLVSPMLREKERKLLSLVPRKASSSPSLEPGGTKEVSGLSLLWPGELPCPWTSSSDCIFPSLGACIWGQWAKETKSRKWVLSFRPKLTSQPQSQRDFLCHPGSTRSPLWQHLLPHLKHIFL